MSCTFCLCSIWAGDGSASSRLRPARVCADGRWPAAEEPEAEAAFAAAANDIPADRHRAPRPRLPGGQETQGANPAPDANRAQAPSSFSSCAANMSKKFTVHKMKQSAWHCCFQLLLGGGAVLQYFLWSVVGTSALRTVSTPTCQIY